MTTTRDVVRRFRAEGLPISAFSGMPPEAAVPLARLDAGTRALVVSMPLWEVRGLGPSRASRLWAQGARVANLERYWDQLPVSTHIALRHHPLTSIPHARVREITRAMIAPADRAACEIAGSWRRERATCGDIDIVYSGASLDAFLARMAQRNGAQWIEVARGDNKVSAVYRVTQRTAVEVDIWVAQPVERASMLLYATGSKLWNVRMRMVAKHRGLKLNQYGLWRADGTRVVARTEREIFDAIRMAWRAPRDREV